MGNGMNKWDAAYYNVDLDIFAIFIRQIDDGVYETLEHIAYMENGTKKYRVKEAYVELEKISEKEIVDTLCTDLNGNYIKGTNKLIEEVGGIENISKDIKVVKYAMRNSVEIMTNGDFIKIAGYERSVGICYEDIVENKCITKLKIKLGVEKRLKMQSEREDWAK